MTILWDWNGTLLADVPLVVRTNNIVFGARGGPAITEESYRRLFRFPVRAYYRDLGVTDAEFPAIAQAWTEAYNANFPGCPLTPGAAETARRFRDAGFRQVIVSASQRDLLRAQVERYPELDGMFEDLLGLEDIYAASKVQLAKDFLASDSIAPADAVFLGDTCHDAEVAREIGCRCYLIAGGHQCTEVLRTSGAEILPSLRAVADRLGA